LIITVCPRSLDPFIYKVYSKQHGSRLLGHTVCPRSSKKADPFYEVTYEVVLSCLVLFYIAAHYQNMARLLGQTVCPRNHKEPDPFYEVTYYTKWV